MHIQGRVGFMKNRGGRKEKEIALWSKKMRLKEVAIFGPKLTTFRPQDRTMVQKDAFKRSREFWPETDHF